MIRGAARPRIRSFHRPLFNIPATIPNTKPLYIHLSKQEIEDLSPGNSMQYEVDQTQLEVGGRDKHLAASAMIYLHSVLERSFDASNVYRKCNEGLVGSNPPRGGGIRHRVLVTYRRCQLYQSVPLRIRMWGLLPQSACPCPREKQTRILVQ